MSHEAIDTQIYSHSKKTLIEHGIRLPSKWWMHKIPSRRAIAGRPFTACD